MTLFKTQSLIETYRAKASSKNINELTGRTGRPDLTRFVAEQVREKLRLQTNFVLVDVGCGDGTFLLEAAANGIDGYEGRLIGLLPTVEEVDRVRSHLLHFSNPENHLISIEVGQQNKTGLPDDVCDVIVCNSVLSGAGQTLYDVELALTEFCRITKSGGVMFFGEIAETDELVEKGYGDRISSWLLWVLKNQGFKAFWTRLKQTIIGLFTREPFVIVPKNMFFAPPDIFIDLLERANLEVIESCRHTEIDTDGNTYENKTRWDYLAIKL